MKTTSLWNLLRTAFVVGIVAAALMREAGAGERPFVYSYEAKPFVPGSIELENWVTWKHDGDFNRLDFRHELEFGITERFQLGFYLVDWRWQETGDESEAFYHDTAVEGIYNILNPNVDPFGLSLYGEVGIGDDLLEVEGKVLLQKNFGPVSLVYNFIVESEWEEDGLSEVKGEWGNTLGLGYQVSPRFSFGAELLHEMEIADWKDGEDSALYLGPNVSVSVGPAWLTVAGLWELTDTGEADFQMRAITGWHF